MSMKKILIWLSAKGCHVNLLKCLSGWVSGKLAKAGQFNLDHNINLLECWIVEKYSAIITLPCY